MKLSVCLFVVMVLLSSVVKKPKSDCGCGVEHRYYLKGKMVKKIYSPQGYIFRCDDVTKLTFEGAVFHYDSITVKIGSKQ